MYRNPYGSEASGVTTQQQSSMARQPKASKPIPCDDEPMDEELWYACAGPQRTLPPLSSLVSYFTQGHLEQVESCNNDADIVVPKYNYKVPAEITCNLIDVRLQAQEPTDEVLAFVCLFPVLDPMLESSSAETLAAPPTRNPVFFTKVLTVSDTSTHGGFSVPRRGAEECFPPLDKTQDNPIQDLIAKDLHGKAWKFRHLFRGQPKRHLLTTGWSVFVSQKRLAAGDTVLFLRGESGQLRIAVRLAPRKQKQTPLVTEPTMALGVLEAAAHAARENARLSLIYNPRSCPSQYIIPYTKYMESKNVNFFPGQRVKSEFAIGDAKTLGAGKNGSAAGNRSRTRFEAEDSSDSRLLGTVVEISDHDPQRWPGSPWRSIKVKWDESCTARQERVSPWEITPYTPRAAQPSSYAAKRRPKAPPPQLQTSDLGPSMTMSMTPGAYGRHDRGLPSPMGNNGMQEVLSGGPRSMDLHEGEHAFRMKLYEKYRSGCDVEAALAPCSPRSGGVLQNRRPITLQPFVKEEPFGSGDAGLHLGVSLGGEGQGSSKASCSQQQQQQQQQSRDWLTSPMPSADTRSSSSSSCRRDLAALSISNLPPADSGSSSHATVSRPGFWANNNQNQVAAATPPSHGDHRVRLFGFSLDRPATPPEELNMNAAQEDPHEEFNMNNAATEDTYLDLRTRVLDRWGPIPPRQACEGCTRDEESKRWIRTEAGWYESPRPFPV